MSHEPVTSTIIELGIHDNRKVGVDSKSPAEVARDNEDLDGPRGEELLHYLTFHLWQTFMEVGHAIGQGLHQCLHMYQQNIITNKTNKHTKIHTNKQTKALKGFTFLQ